MFENRPHPKLESRPHAPSPRGAEYRSPGSQPPSRVGKAASNGSSRSPAKATDDLSPCPPVKFQKPTEVRFCTMRRFDFFLLFPPRNHILVWATLKRPTS